MAGVSSERRDELLAQAGEGRRLIAYRGIPVVGDLAYNRDGTEPGRIGTGWKIGAIVFLLILYGLIAYLIVWAVGQL